LSIWSTLNHLEFEHRWISVDGIRTRVLKAGSGPDVICLHGTSGHLEAFTRNVAPLAEAGFTVHALDMLGHGLTDKPDFDYTPPRHAEHLRSYIRSEGLDRPSIVGESLGGWAAAWYASEYPESVGRVILVAPGGTRATPAVMDRIKSSTELAVRTPSLARTRERLELLMYDPADVTDELVEIRHDIYTRPEFRSALHHVLCLQEMGGRVPFLLDATRLKEITAPALLIWGRQNPFGKLDEADFIAASIPSCTLEIFDECGHWPQYEKADQFNEMAIRFLSAID
jgi:2-hydroxy-6-oxonona-2,4-dienedioate hydrolase